MRKKASKTIKNHLLSASLPPVTGSQITETSYRINLPEREIHHQSIKITDKIAVRICHNMEKEIL